MSDLRPLLAEDLTEDERRLLRSARIDVPPRSGKLRTVAAMGLAAATAAGTSGASAATAGAGLMVKWMALGALGGTIALGAAGGLTPLVKGLVPPSMPAQRAAQGVSRAAPTALPQASYAKAPPLTDPEGIEHPRAPLDSLAPAPSGTSTTRTAHRRPADTPAAATPPQETPIPPPAAETTLIAEVGALDEARRALASGDAISALRALDAYDRQFPRRRLGPEATVLRIEVLLAGGRTRQAQELGDVLLAAEPNGAYAQHVRSLLSGAHR